jgi:hypothetical protein
MMAGKGVVNVKMYAMMNGAKETGVQVITSTDEMSGKEKLEDGVQHLSVFCQERTPSIREIYIAKNFFFPNIEMAMYLKAGELTLGNSHHLWQTKTEEQKNGAKILQL